MAVMANNFKALKNEGSSDFNDQGVKNRWKWEWLWSKSMRAIYQIVFAKQIGQDMSFVYTVIARSTMAQMERQS